MEEAARVTEVTVNEKGGLKTAPLVANPQIFCTLDTVDCDNELYATITGFNTVPEQTDATPCISSANVDICGRTDVAACPARYPLGTVVSIAGKHYHCLDRTAEKYGDRFDISFDKDIKAAKAFGKQYLPVMVLE